MNVPLHTGASLGSSDKKKKKKMQRYLPERQTERKNRCLRLPRHTGNPQLKYGKASATTAWKTKSTRTLTLVSLCEKTGDSRFAPNLLPYIDIRAVFSGSRAQLWEGSMEYGLEWPTNAIFFFFFYHRIREKQLFTLPVVNDNEIVRSTSDGVVGKSGLICLVRYIRTRIELSCWCRRVSQFLLTLTMGWDTMALAGHLGPCETRLS